MYILVLHGPNLNLLGTREVELYGGATLADIDGALTRRAEQLGWRLDTLQSNGEQELLERIHRGAKEGVDFIIFNPAAFTHVSVALRDALLATSLPFVEVHLSNIYGREEFRAHSYFSDIAQGVISGFGAGVYTLALEAVRQLLEQDGERQPSGAKSKE